MSIINRNDHRKVNVEPQHTPTPWQLKNLEGSDLPFIVSTTQSSYAVADTGLGSVSSAEAWANAAFIVRAVNSHEALVEALQDVLDLAEDLDGDTQNLTVTMSIESWSRIEDLIAQAKGGK